MLVATYEDAGTAAEMRLVREGEAAAETLHAPTPRPCASAPHVRPEEVTYASLDGVEIPGVPVPPRRGVGRSPGPAVVYPHGGRTSCDGDEWDGHAQYFDSPRQLTRGSRSTSAARPATAASSSGETTETGRAGTPRTASPQPTTCARSTGSTATVSPIFGASYGSYLALLSPSPTIPEHRYRCAVAKYGDCDILTSWAQGDREGVQDMGRIMADPSLDPAAIAAGSPVRIGSRTCEAPLLIAHGELDLRVNPRQSEQLVRELRRLGGKTFEYVTYPTEAHGFLRAGPQLHFYRRLEAVPRLVPDVAPRSR